MKPPHNIDRILTADLIRQAKEKIIDHWKSRVLNEISNTKKSDRLYLSDLLPQSLEHLALFLELGESSESFVKLEELAIEQSDQRTLQKDDVLDQVIMEYQILREIILSTVKNADKMTTEVREIISDFFVLAIRHAVAQFSKLDRNEPETAQSGLYNFILQSPSPIAILLGPEHRFLITNQAYDRLAGRKCMGKTVREAFTQAEAGDFIPLLDNVYRTGTPFSGKELAATFPDDHGMTRERFLNVTYYPFRNERGEIIGIITDQQEVTEYVRARKAVEESKAALVAEQEKLETIFQNAPAAMALWKGPDLVFEKVNPEFEKAFGYRQLVGQPLLEAYPELKGQGFDELLLSVLHTGKPFMANNMPMRIAKSENGPVENRYYDFSCVRIMDRENKPYGVYIHAVDVTDQMQAQQRLKESEELLRLAIRGGNMGAWTILLPEGKLFLDQSAKEITGFFEDVENFGVAIDKRVHPDDRDMIHNAFRNSIKDSTVLKVECRSQNANGDWRWFAIRGEPRIGENGKAISLSGVLFDITDQKFLQHELELAKIDAERANQAKSAFLANMSHEIRTPLSSILGFSKLLKDEPPNSPERDRYVDAIDRNGMALTRLIDDILDLAKIESGRVELELIEFSLYDLVSDAVELFREKAGKKNLSLNLSVDEVVSDRICSDPTRLRQILLNLIDNAVKFTEKGGVHVHVRTMPSAIKNKAKLLIDVEDSGIGLTEEQKRKLFQPFVQADNSTTRNFGGTGLGLALSQRLAEALGGKITIGKCSLQAGCTFTLAFSVTLPKSDQHSRSENKNRDKPETSPLEGMHILVVDDSQDIQFLVKRLLTQNGATVESAANGLEGVAKATSDSYDVILMDIQMPQMDGYQAKKALDEVGYRTPVIALTAHAMSEERQRTVEAGFATHLTKPLIANELFKAVSDIGKVLH